jgi:hypothetical protein
MPVLPALARWRERQAPAPLTWAADAAGAGALVLLLGASIVQMAARTYNPFIYFRF